MIDIVKIEQDFQADTALLSSEQLKNKYLGRKNGIVSNALKELASLSLEEKQRYGTELNKLRGQIEAKILEKEVQTNKLVSHIDFSIPGIQPSIGHLHPITLVQKELEDIFKSLGFTVEYGPEIENDFYNFTALNMPELHPARDMQDTFYVNKKTVPNSPDQNLVLRTHISNIQVRFMETHKPPFAIISPGTVYRNEAIDTTHEHTYFYMEGMVVGEDINFANMVWVFEQAFKKLMGPETKIRLQPTYYPFVEPGAELAMSNPKFKNGQWIEMLGCGMVHQKVFEFAGYPRNKYQGFAFGGGSRFPLLKYAIPDIRLLKENNLQFLNQF
jgi:phenylalanyl-tRNA synthetase alpha chain